MIEYDQEQQGTQQGRWIMLVDRVRPTEDIYFLVSVAPVLRNQGMYVKEIDTRRNWCPWWRSAELPSLFEGANVLICRSLPRAWLHWLFQHKAIIGRIIYLIDDNIEAASNDTTLPIAYRRRMRRVAKLQPSMIALADEVVTPSQQLAETLRLKHAHVSVLPPPLLAPLPPLLHFKEPPNETRPWQVGFHGTRSHVADLAQIAPAIIQLHDQREDVMFEVMLGEHTPKALKLLHRCVTPAPLPWKAFHEYQRQRRIHIGLAPLLPTAFNRGKSYIKFLDIAAMGGVGIFSNRYPYDEIIEHGVDGLLADDDPDDWLHCMQVLLDDPEATLAMARAAAKKAAAIGHHQHALSFWLARSAAISHSPSTGS